MNYLIWGAFGNLLLQSLHSTLYDLPNYEKKMDKTFNNDNPSVDFSKRIIDFNMRVSSKIAA